MAQAHDSDERLMQRVAQGEREPLSLLLRRYATPLLTFLRRMNGDHHRSEECFQDAFLAVWTGREKYQFPRPFRAWLFGIALNKCRAVLRSQWPEFTTWEESVDAMPASEASAPVEIAIATETAALVQKAVLHLPGQQRAVVVMRVWNGLSYAEIAEILGRAEATVRSNMFHAIDSLRRFLGPRL